MTFFQHDFRPPDMSMKSIDQAFIKAHKSVLLGDMSRHDAADAATTTRDLQRLPIGHLIDHRLRSTLLPPLTDGDNPSEDDWDRNVPVIAEWLGHLLNAADRPGARALVTKALKLTPETDAHDFARLGRAHHGFFRACSQGRLGIALRTVKEDRFPSGEREAAIAFVTKLLLYFSCFSIQLVAARAWWIDHLPFRKAEGSGPYRLAALAQDVDSWIDVIRGSAAYMAGERKRPPNRNDVLDNMQLARQWREAQPADDKTLRAELNAFFAAVTPMLEELATSVRPILKRAKRNNETVHSWIYGVTAGEALAFGATRLVQLRREAAAMVARRVEGRRWKALSLRREDFPSYIDKDVATLLYVFRITILGDPAASLIFENKQCGLESLNPRSDLCDLLSRYSEERHGEETDMPGTSVLKEARKQYGKATIARRPLVQGALQHHERLDIIPEFWLQADLPLHGSIAPTVGIDLLMRKSQLRDRIQHSRPANVRRASGKGRS